MNSKTSLLKSLFGRNLSLERINAVSNVSIKINRGEVVGVIGRNGAGKSTLLQIICGTLTPSSGTVSVNGKIGALLELGAGFHPDFTGIENVYLTASMMGLSKRQVDEALEHIVDFADIGDFINTPVRTYSTGMSMRLAFSVATSTSPDILIIDEALSVGDQEFAQKSFNRIMELRDMGTTILFCSHSTYQVEALCERVLWLEKGKMVKLGPAKEVTTAYLEDQEIQSYKHEKPLGKSVADQNASNSQIKKIEFFKNGESCSNTTSMYSRTDDLKVKVSFHAVKNEPTLAITIRKNSGEIVASAGSLNDKSSYIINAANQKYFEIDFKKITLLKGNYFIDVSLFCEHGINTLDYATRVLELKILQNDLEQGVAHLNHKWKN
tara:strand:- start:3260 stop:4402 length:1143 start_codon:yes stop_codon:yes gene_type:complete